MMKNILYRKSLVPSNDVYLSYDLSPYYGTTRLVGNMQTGEETNAFVVILSFFRGMYFDILAKACTFVIFRM